MEAMRQFWDVALGRYKAYAEAAEPRAQPTRVTPHSTPLIDAGDESFEGDVGAAADVARAQDG